MKKSHPVIAICVARLREFTRQPEAIFWVYFFPILMVVVLGIAFRNKPVESFDVDVVSGPIADSIVEKLESDDRIKPRIVSEEESIDRLRASKTNLMIAARTETLEEIEYRYDPVRPGSLAARNLVDRRLQEWF